MTKKIEKIEFVKNISTNEFVYIADDKIIWKLPIVNGVNDNINMIAAISFFVGIIKGILLFQDNIFVLNVKDENDQYIIRDTYWKDI
jgi:hypothetical protein